MDTASPSLPIERRSPDVGDLFGGFLTLGLIGFGGVLPLARRMVVEERGWLGEEEFADLLGLCQFLPGGNIINMAVAIGLRFRGVPGACAALLGLIAAPTAIVIGLGVLYDRFHADPHIQHLFAGLAAAAAGLLVSMAIKVARPLRRDAVGIGIACLCFASIALVRLPLLATMLVVAPASILLAWRRA